MEPVTETILQLPGHGSLKGLRLGTYARQFVNVPYAQPPVGVLRWRKPVSLPDNYVYGVQGEPRDCTSFGPICHQPEYIVNGASVAAVESLKV